LFGQRATDDLAGIAHEIRLVVAGRVVAILAEADALEELSELPSLVGCERDGDLDGFQVLLSWCVQRSPRALSAARITTSAEPAKPTAVPASLGRI
jgi:hypothetical protein